MHRVPIEALATGMRIGKTIVSSDGRPLLLAGTELTDTYIRILRRIPVPAVYITNELAPDVEPQDVVSEQTRQGLSSSMRGVVTEIIHTVGGSLKHGRRKFSGGFDTAKVKSGVDSVVTELLRNPRALVNLQDIRSADDYALGHAVNVCILTVLMGMSLGLNLTQLNELGMGALMHDIGKAVLPKELVQKHGLLTPEEYEVMKEHTTLGWELLSKQPDISYLSSAVALQHHERWSGKGYPRQIKEKEVHLYSRVAAIVDMYDDLVADRPDRRGYHPVRALRYMNELTSDFFDPELLQMFTESVAVFPVGSMVELTGGYQAIVVAVERGKTTRPRIRLVRDQSGAILTKIVEIDLSAQPNILITRALNDPTHPFSPGIVH